MKYIKTPKIIIDNIDYTEQLKGQTLQADLNLINIPVKTPLNSTITVKISSPKISGGTLVTQFYRNSVIFGTKYNNNYTPILQNITSSSGEKWDICNGQLYFDNVLFNSDEDWEKLSYDGIFINSLDENYVIYAIKNSELYRCYYLKITNPQNSEITYEPRISKIETSYLFKDLTGSCNWKYDSDVNYKYPRPVFGLTLDNELISIDRYGNLDKIDENVTQIAQMYPTSDNYRLLYEKSGDIYRASFWSTSLTPTLPTTGRVCVLPKKNYIILPGGDGGNNFPGVPLIICDGNLYAGQNCISNTGSWTQVSTGYECGYGIDDGKLYKIYGTDSSWYMRTPTSANITLIDDSKIWSYVWCDYSTGTAFTSTGDMYSIRDIQITRRRTLSLGDWNTTYKEYQHVYNCGQDSSTKTITLPVELINTLIEES